jgi:hypothetical protein
MHRATDSVQISILGMVCSASFSLAGWSVLGGSSFSEKYKFLLPLTL